MTRPPAFPGRLAVLGHPVAHSRSPAFQNAALRAAGIPLTYEAIDVSPPDLPGLLADFAAVRGAGNATIPHKHAVFAACSGVTERAARTGAVNTFWHDADGRLHGDNTDSAGFDAAVATLGTHREGARVVMLGAGGAAAGVCAAIALWPGATVHIGARSPEKARQLVARFPGVAHLLDDRDDALDRATLVVNATPVGMREDDVPLEVHRLPADADVMDLVYRVGDTAWVRQARARGHRAIDGREMLLHQGAEAFRCWFQRDPDLTIMRNALEQPAAPR